jgi:two-component system sensor histidine kinase YesM
MKKLNRGRSWNSIRFKLVIAMLFTTIPLITMLLYNNFYAINVVRKQVAESNSNMVSLYKNQIDNSLNEVDNYLSNLMASETDMISLGEGRVGTESETSYKMASILLSKKLSNDILMYKSIDAMFVYSVKAKDFLEAYVDQVPFEFREKVRAYIRSIEQPDFYSRYARSWKVQKIDQDYYLIRILRKGDTIIGSYVNAKKMLKPFDLLDLGSDGVSLLVTGQGEAMNNSSIIDANQIDLKHDFSSYYLSGDKNKFLVIGKPSDRGDFSLVAIIPDKQILENLPYLRIIVLLIAVAAVTIFPMGLFILKKTVLVPLNRIVNVMRRIGEGNLKVRIAPYRTSDEFQLVNDSFNNMVTQIESLRINVYEEQINKQKAEFQQLQLQINPHFFINSLNIIYGLAQVKNFHLIQELAVCLGQFFRYMFKSSLTFVPLTDELHHIRNYIRIQELRSPHCLTCDIKVPDVLLECRVPPLSILTFVENTVKHAVTLDEQVRLFITIDPLDEGEEHYLKVTIQDTGQGFPNVVLSELLAGKRIVDANGEEHIGIWNVQQRLRMLYGEIAQISFGNGNPTGAVIELILPIRPNKEE